MHVCAQVEELKRELEETKQQQQYYEKLQLQHQHQLQQQEEQQALEQQQLALLQQQSAMKTKLSEQIELMGNGTPHQVRPSNKKVPPQGGG
jgi:hypothetical protein